MYWRMSTHLLPAHTNTSVRAISEIQILPATCYHLEHLQPTWNHIWAINPKYLSLLKISLISINNSDMSTANCCETTASSLVQSDMGCLPRYFSSFSALAKSPNSYAGSWISLFLFSFSSPESLYSTVIHQSSSYLPNQPGETADINIYELKPRCPCITLLMCGYSQCWWWIQGGCHSHLSL